ncbi:DUF1767 domain protein [Medicago truncatula]|uniref:DUF1767 domain protein n=1 Tax=Medicago truncatula TaxID=3880 RepID=G7ICR5_MEDTR|nr:DUF1767 domain protein [Medicago truncatula]
MTWMSGEKKKVCFRKFLFSDLHSCGSRILPTPIELKLKTTLPGTYVLQVRFQFRYLLVTNPCFARVQ